MQKINEEGTIKTQCILLLLKSPTILDQFRGADLKQIISVHKRCVVISSPDFVVVYFRVTINPLKPPRGLIYFKPIWRGGGGGGGLIFFKKTMAKFNQK